MSAVTLNPLAVSASDLLRAIKAGGWVTKAELAQAAGRLPNHIARDLRALETAGLILQPDEPVGAILLSDDGIAQLAAIDRAESPAANGEPGLPATGSDPRWPHQRSQILFLSHAQILPDPANARRDWDSDDARSELDALRQDILENGLLLNLVVTGPTETGSWSIGGPDGAALPAYTLAAGERRWRAIGLAIAEDDWPADRAIPCRLLETDDVGVRIAALSENLQRRDLNPIEKAQGFEGLVEAGLTNQDIADRFGKTAEHVQQHRSFLRLNEADQARMVLPRDDKKRLTVREARELVAAMNRADAQAREPAPELDVSPIERLTAAEILHAVHARASYTYDDVEVGPDAASDPFMQALAEAGMFRAPELRRHGVMQGRWVVSIAHGFPFAAFPTLRAGEAADFDAGLAGERAKLEDIAGTSADVTEDRPYVTAWLNGPFEISPEGQAILDAATAAELERIESNSRATIERAELEAAHAAARARSRALFEQTRVATVAGRLDALEEIVTQADAPTPWRISQTGNVVAADGQEIIRNGSAPQSEARLRLMVLAVNAAARVETPVDDEPEPVAQELDEEGFTEALLDSLRAQSIELADHTSDRASDILAAFLTTNGIAFGDDAFDWTVGGAADLIADELANQMALDAQAEDEAED